MNIITNDLIDAAFDRIWNNLGAALRISLIPFAIAAAIVLGLHIETINVFYRGHNENIPFFALRLFASALCLVGAGFYVAVTWHRFGLGRGSGLWPMVSYAFLSIVLSFLLLLCVAILGAVVSAITSVAAGGGQISFRVSIGSYEQALQTGPIAVALNFVGTLLFYYVFLRISPFLVAVATGDTRRVSAFDQTYPHHWMVAHTALIYAVATLLWGLTGLAALPVWVAFAVNVALM